MACSTVWVSRGAPPIANAALILSLPCPGIEHVGVARDRHRRRLRAGPERRQWTSRMVSVRPLPMSPPVARSCCCSAVRPWRLSEPDEQPVGAAAGAGPIGVVRQHRLAVQRRVEPHGSADDAGAGQQQARSAGSTASTRPQRRLRRVFGATPGAGAGVGGPPRSAVRRRAAGGGAAAATAVAADGLIGRRWRRAGFAANHLRRFRPRRRRWDRPRGRPRSGDRSPSTWITYVPGPGAAGCSRQRGSGAGAQAVDERATHQHPDGLAQSGHVVHRLVEAAAGCRGRRRRLRRETARRTGRGPAAGPVRGAAARAAWTPVARRRRCGRCPGARASWIRSRRTGRAGLRAGPPALTGSAPVASVTTTESISSRSRL